MRLSKLSHNAINKKIATVIKSKDGRKLLDAGTTLSERILSRLSNYQLNAIYIEDENVDVELQETIDADTKTHIIKKMNAIYTGIEKGKFDESEINNLVQKDILINVKSYPISIPIGGILDEDDMAEHALNVCLLSVATARRIGLDEGKVEILAKAALLHDIGKLIKSSKKDIGHEQSGYEFLKVNTSSPLLYTTVRYHHETSDGKGPQSHPANYQHDMVKIISLANYYERTLRQGKLLPYECFERVQAMVNVKFESHIFEAFKQSTYVYPIGLPVKLSNKEEGILIRQNAKYPLRPIIRTKSTEYNLLEHLSLFIEEVLI